MSEAEDRRAFLADEAKQFRANALQRALDDERYDLRTARSAIASHEADIEWTMKEINAIKRAALAEGIDLK
ncbi:hypothetical protein EVC29_078 [Rhizobium phage RHph_Y52]|nr:hypothetical protein EVB53_076 [Rhizobium phage RHph_Y60]QIG73386.1 hypothetical protein EVC03_078 [Rhizobium phage RHph_Y5A]QIG75307.1 hypothetical protein EVC16_078 [Rhizobium phage RHph_Y21]QIG75520.1 hypothetical protein EVC18_078 [Rhizobium phage RHph_Y2_4]QIG76779.1 hypothetical protein EVC29_078 [Rhizobium phage RHph_Y52]